MILGERFRVARERVNLTQGQVAKYADTGQGYLSDIELNKRVPSTWELLIRLAGLYKCSTDYLLGVTDDPSLRDAPPLSETMQQIVVLGNQLSPARQRDILRIVATFIDQGEPGPGLSQSARDKALGRKPDAPHIIGGEK